MSRKVRCDQWANIPCPHCAKDMTIVSIVPTGAAADYLPAEIIAADQARYDSLREWLGSGSSVRVTRDHGQIVAGNN